MNFVQISPTNSPYTKLTKNLHETYNVSKHLHRDQTLKKDLTVNTLSAIVSMSA